MRRVNGMMALRAYVAMDIALKWQILQTMTIVVRNGKKMKSYVDILGTRYRIEVHKISEDSYMKDNQFDGYCSEYEKLIVIADVNEYEYFKCASATEKENITKSILRHEIVHAHLNESGLSSCSNEFCGAWAKHKEMVDWMAIQIPKIVKAYEWCECI